MADVSDLNIPTNPAWETDVSIKVIKIIGNKKINGVEPGDVVEIKDDLIADSLVAGGHLEKIKSDSKKKKGAK